MQKESSDTVKMFAAIAALLGWFAIAAQFYLILEMRVSSVPETIIRFFSFFTVLSNIITALCFTGLLLDPKYALHRFFSKPGNQTAVTVYIIIVGAVYNLVLRFIWNPEGLQKIVDEVLHSVIPVLMVIFWLVFTNKNKLQWKDTLQWMLYPISYTIFIAIRGAFSGFYPYPFINVPVIGYPRALLNGAGLVLVFMGLSLFLIAVARIMCRRQLKNQK